MKLINHLDIESNEFLMIGNTLKSDILPVLNLGGFGIHIPYHTTWAHEQIEQSIVNDQFKHVEHIIEILSILDSTK
jgi:putative hydrolase of the HAD superfamily